MSTPVFSTLDINNPEEIAQFEKGLFRAFSGSADPSLDLIWTTDLKNRRMSPKVPYATQEIYTVRVYDALLTAVAVNFNMSGTLQLEMLGFSIDKNQPGLCEGLSIFNNQQFDGTNLLAFLMRDYGLTQLRLKGIKMIYGTCTRKKVRGYQTIGFKIVDERMIADQTEYLLEMDI